MNMNKLADNEITGSFVQFDNDEFYKISNAQDMPPFFINLASNSDIWMFFSSNGSLTAGRKEASLAVFPYDTDDRIHIDSFTGPKTVVRITESDSIKLWEPFDKSIVNPYRFTRNLYKNIWGNALVYEEINHTLNLSFRYKWENSEKFGIVRTSCITNLIDKQREIAVFDGVQNIMPYGINEGLPGCLADAYKHAELDGATNIAIYSLTSKIGDTTNAVEVLRATVVWSVLPESKNKAVVLSENQMKKFCAGSDLESETLSLGKKCAYFTYQNFYLPPSGLIEWVMVMDAGLDQSAVALLQNKIRKADKAAIFNEIKADIKECTRQLQLNIASADGMQCTNDTVASKHHFYNVLYNNMRGGIFDDGYLFDYKELVKFVNMRNKPLFENNKEFFENIKKCPEKSVICLKNAAYKTGNADLIRICLEFLPVCFSRRHGDPSRPWNRFNINLKDADGKRMYHYEGNWRDIFQNWEAMCLSFPEYLDNIIAKFVNASTADGFNPYRINTEGIDWEAPDPGNPFSGGIGYWGDHQIVYLTKLLEALYAHNPAAFDKLFENDVFSYANVPYRILNYESILKDSKQTIKFDFGLHNSVLEKAKNMGSDAKLILNDNKVFHVSFMEKLIVPILVKLSNLVVGGGIWMNTQRPEWNDANNAIVGIGLSMVTVYQLRRHLLFCKKLISNYNYNGKTAKISIEVAEYLTNIFNVLKKYAESLNEKLDGKIKKEILDNLGNAFSVYREKIYTSGFGGKINFAYDSVAELFDIALKYIDYTIDVNKSSNGFYNAYNILRIDSKENTLTVSPMFPMLEGQTAAVGSGKMSPRKTISLIETMENSDIYSHEQHTFYLYPLKKLKTFMQKNIVPKNTADNSPLINALIKNNNTALVVKDENGDVRLNAGIVQESILVYVLNELKKDENYKELIENEFNKLCDCYEEMFRHSEFTGRSGIMYKYEGIGSVYWHQNAKFILSVGENFINSYDEEEQPDNLKQLKDAYYRLRRGLGFSKNAKEWGAFPLDPYSHTPYLQGAQQPGMTGQVKEEILTRRLELGVMISDGEISFVPALLRKSEFLSAPAKFTYFSLDKQKYEMPLEKDTLAYTLCQIPVIYKLSDENKISFETQDKILEIPGLTINKELSGKVFLRDNNIKRIIVNIKQSEMV